MRRVRDECKYDTIILGKSDSGRAYAPWHILPNCPICTKDCLWIYPDGQDDLLNLEPYYPQMPASFFVGCYNCYFRTEVFSELKDCLISSNLVDISLFDKMQSQIH